LLIIYFSGQQNSNMHRLNQPWVGIHSFFRSEGDYKSFSKLILLLEIDNYVFFCRRLCFERESEREMFLTGELQF